MKTENYTRLSIDVPPEVHKVMKFHIIENHLNIKNYVLNLIKEDLSEELEDYALGQMALESEKNGYLGVKKSTSFLKNALKTPSKKISQRKNTTNKTSKNAKIKFK